MKESRNAVIESATITNDDNGHLSAWIHLYHITTAWLTDLVCGVRGIYIPKQGKP